jgi:hypothetical protein
VVESSRTLDFGEVIQKNHLIRCNDRDLMQSLLKHRGARRKPLAKELQIELLRKDLDNEVGAHVSLQLLSSLQDP